jgi:hypothetical protein
MYRETNVHVITHEPVFVSRSLLDSNGYSKGSDVFCYSLRGLVVLNFIVSHLHFIGTTSDRQKNW